MHKVSEWKDVIQKGINIPYCKRQSIIDSHTLLHLLVSKYMIPNLAGLYISGEGGFTHGGVEMSQTMVQKASEQVKKVRDALEDEIRQFQETGEVVLGFKDNELYDRTAKLEGQVNQNLSAIIELDDKCINLNERIIQITQYYDKFHMIEHLMINLEKQSELNKTQSAVIVNTTEKIANLEKRLSENRDQMLAFEHLLTMLVEQKSPVEPTPFVEKESAEQENAEEGPEVIPVDFSKEEYEDFIYVFLPASILLIVMLLYTLYHHLRQ